MSIRPEIFGVNLDRFFARLGSGDRRLIERVQEALREGAEDWGGLDEDKEQNAEFERQQREVLERAVMHGVPFEGLDDEGDAHVGVATVLVGIDGDAYDTGSNGWRMQAFWEFPQEYRQSFSPQVNELWGYFEEGRPVFGRRIKTDWSYYGYLRRDEVTTMRQALETLRRQHAELTGGGEWAFFTEELLRWVAAIEERGLDLWLYTF